MSIRKLPGVEDSRRLRLTTSADILKKCGSLDVSQIYAPSWPVTRTALNHNIIFMLCEISNVFSSLSLNIKETNQHLRNVLFKVMVSYSYIVLQGFIIRTTIIDK
jgi:hypothetical protein